MLGGGREGRGEGEKGEDEEERKGNIFLCFLLVVFKFLFLSPSLSHFLFPFSLFSLLSHTMFL